MTPEQLARQEIDRLLGMAGWAVQSVDAVNHHAARGVVVREFPLNPGHGFADYLLYLDGKAAGVVAAKNQGATMYLQFRTLSSDGTTSRDARGDQ